MTAGNEEGAKGSFFESRLFRGLIVLALAAVFLPPWWSPFWGGGSSGPEVKITVTSEGLEVTVPEDDVNVDAEVTCVYLFTSETGLTRSEVVTISNGATQVVGVTEEFADDMNITYTISCHVGEDAVFDSGIIEVGAA